MNDENSGKFSLRNTLKLAILIIAVMLLCYALNYYTDKQVIKAEISDEEIVVGVHVKGEVKASGYYELSYGQRVKDAIEKAGGCTEEADINAVNLAEKLRDGDEIIIPSKNKQPENISDGKVNINSANIYELMSIDGIGESIAKQIVSYREKNGSFKRITDLKNINGIGASKFNKIKENIKVSD